MPPSMRPPARPSTGAGLTRRSFLRGVGGVLAAGAAARCLDPFVLGAAAEESFGATLPVGTPVLVLVELTGGCDILNTVVPFGVPTTTGLYRSARPGIGLTQLTTTRPYGLPTPGDYSPPCLDLDGQWALHGALPFLANRWHDVGDVALVQGTGENVVRDMSHFAAWAFRWAGAFGGTLMSTGWLGRYNDLANTGQALGAVSLTGAHQALASLHAPSVAIADLDGFGFQAQNVPDRDRFLDDVGAFGDPASTAVHKVGVASRALALADQAATVAAGVPRLAAGGSSGSLPHQLSTAASLIQAGIPCQTYVASLGGFDTHGSEPYNLWERLTELNAGLAHFFSLLDGTPRAADVFVLIHSEFGRQVGQNAGQGTDHGQASGTIFVGGGVRGGRYGEAPSLAVADRDSDAMVATVDFRSVYATALNRLGGDPNLTDEAQGRDESGQPFADLGVFAGLPAAGLPEGAQARGADGVSVPPARPDVAGDLRPYVVAQV